MTLDKLIEREKDKRRRAAIIDLWEELKALGPKRTSVDGDHYYVQPYIVGAHLRRRRRHLKIVKKLQA